MKYYQVLDNLNLKMTSSLEDLLDHGFTTRETDITQLYGKNPAIYKQFGLAGHNGIDLSRATNIPIYNFLDGKVIDINKTDRGYGFYVYIRSLEPDENGNYIDTIYGHFDSIDVNLGDVLTVRTKLGIMGTTGFSTGIHLHFGLRKVKNKEGWDIIDVDNGYNGWIDPLPYLKMSLKTMVDKNLLEKLYKFGFKRLPDELANYYIGKDIDTVLNELLISEENKYYTQVFEKVKELENWARK